MSPALFFFPELPVYLLCSLVTATPQQALALNGVLVLLAVYALVRAAANELMPAARRSARITVSALALGFVTAIVLTEYTATATSLELGSLLLTTTYYYGALLAMLGTAVLALRAVRTGRASATVLVVTGLVAACTTASNPLLRAVVGGTRRRDLVLLSLARRVPWRPTVWMSGALVAGSVVGYLLRIPLAPFVSLDPSTYVHPEQAGRTLAFFAALTDDRAGSARATPSCCCSSRGVVLAVGGTVWAWRVRTARTVLVATVLPLVTVVAVSVGVVVAGSQTPRYLEPIVTVPLLALVAVAELVRSAVRRTRVHRPRRGVQLTVAVAAAVVLVGGVAVAPSTVGAVASARYAPAACLDRWGRRAEGHRRRAVLDGPAPGRVRVGRRRAPAGPGHLRDLPVARRPRCLPGRGADLRGDRCERRLDHRGRGLARCPGHHHALHRVRRLRLRGHGRRGGAAARRGGQRGRDPT